MMAYPYQTNVPVTFVTVQVPRQEQEWMPAAVTLSLVGQLLTLVILWLIFQRVCLRQKTA